MSFSTHKTLPGPQHGAFISNREDMIEDMKTAAFPALFSNHHLHNVAGLAVVLLEMLEFGKEYHKNVISNAQALAEALSDHGFNVLCEDQGFTKSHQIVLKIVEFEKTVGLGGDIEELLEKANIIINRNLLPNCIREGRHYMNPGGLRLGTSEITRLGMGKQEMVDIAEYFKRLIVDQEDPKKLVGEVKEFKKEFLEVKYCFQPGNKAFEYLKFY